MDILKHGTTYKITICEECNCEFGYSYKDIQDESRAEEFYGDWHSIIKEFIDCPECNNKIYIKYEIDGESIID